MTRKINTPKGDRARDRAARRAKPGHIPVEGNKIRVRSKRLDQIDTARLTLAYWLLAKEIAEDKTDDRELTRQRVEEVADQLDQAGDAGEGDQS